MSIVNRACMGHCQAWPCANHPRQDLRVAPAAAPFTQHSSCLTDDDRMVMMVNRTCMRHRLSGVAMCTPLSPPSSCCTCSRRIHGLGAPNSLTDGNEKDGDGGKQDLYVTLTAMLGHVATPTTFTVLLLHPPHCFNS